MPAEDVVKTQVIASLRIHVERAINKIKNFHIWDRITQLTSTKCGRFVVSYVTFRIPFYLNNNLRTHDLIANTGYSKLKFSLFFF